MAVNKIQKELKKTSISVSPDPASKYSDVNLSAKTVFEDLEIAPRLLQGVKAMNLTEPTAIQSAAWKSVTDPDCRDIVIHAETGSGKTLSYLLPLVNLLLRENKLDGQPPITRSMGVLLLVLVPTRELVTQVLNVCRTLLRYIPFLIPGCVMGGEAKTKEKARLRRGNHILVATPGRLLDHMRSTQSFILSHLKFIALDEADRLLSEGFEQDIRTFSEIIGDKLGDKELCKKILISATLTSSVLRLTHFMLRNPTVVRVGSEQGSIDSTKLAQCQTMKSDSIGAGMPHTVIDRESIIIPSALEQAYVICPAKHRCVILIAFLFDHLFRDSIPSDHARYEVNPPVGKVIVFVNTTAEVEFLYLLLSKLSVPSLWNSTRHATRFSSHNSVDGGDEGIWHSGQNTVLGSSNTEDFTLFRHVNVYQLHGSMTQNDRNAVFKSFDAQISGVLVCTDVAARGLDIAEVQSVVHYDPPLDETMYIHRTGRTARMGHKGSSCIFLLPHEAEFVDHLLSLGVVVERKSHFNWLYGLLRASGLSKTNTIWDCAHQLQQEVQGVVGRNQRVNSAATSAFIQWRAAYSTYASHLRKFFDAKEIHLGFLARSFGLAMPPSQIGRFAMKNNTLEGKRGKSYPEYGECSKKKKIDTAVRDNSSLSEFM